jgi:hypothetical protein
MIRRRLLALVSSWLPRRDIIDDAGTLYLSRFLVLGDMMARRVPFTVYLHRFHRPDEDRALHNHPWPWAVSLILTGGYAEHRRPEQFYAHSPDGKHTMRVSMGNLTQARWLRAGSLNFLRGDTFHRVAELDGETWTLFVVGRKKQPWGFDVPGRGFVPWRVREAEHRAARAGGAL